MGSTILTDYPVSPSCVVCADCGKFTDTLFFPVYAGSDGKTYCVDCNPWSICDDCGALCDADDVRDCNGLNANSSRCGCDVYCDNCWTDRYTICSDCGNVVDSDDVCGRDGYATCADCIRSYGEWNVSGWKDKSGCIDRIGSSRCFGVEVETNECDNYADLYDDSAWGCKNDCSVYGKEFVSDILHGDAGLDEVTRLMDFADDNGWAVGDNCGLHIHLDARNESDEQLVCAAQAYISTYSVWSRFVDYDRVGNRYCDKNSADINEFDDYRDFSQFAGCQGRFEYCNFAAYNEHNTFEIRLHHATLDGRAICNWIRAHVCFMDWATCNGKAAIRELVKLDTNGKFALIARIWTDAGCADLVDYYGEKGGFDCADAPAFSVSNELANRINNLVSARW